MWLDKFVIDHYRSIENVEINLPRNKPLVLFGPNNAGKSNILSGFNTAIGERYPTYVEMVDSDYYQRDKEDYPEINFTCTFSEPYYRGHKVMCISYGYKTENGRDNLIHDGEGIKYYLRNEDRAKCQAYFVDAERDIQKAFNYGSKYSLLSRFSKTIHCAMSQENKERLENIYNEIKKAFLETKQCKDFFRELSSSINDVVKGFSHSLDIDLSAYDPNNYAKNIRVVAKENDEIRSFDEFGTGEQQILLMAFVKAYMQVFTSESFILIIEEPEAHLHPLAQRWLKEYLIKLCESGVQVIISTHSTEFLDAGYLDSLVRVYKEDRITRIKQLSAEDLVAYCVGMGVPAERTNTTNIFDFYKACLFHDQLIGFFAEKIILVEGETETFALPYYFRNCECSLAQNGIEIVNCRGKSSMPKYYRLFNAYGYKCFCLFDADSEPGNNEIIKQLLGIDEINADPDIYEYSSDYMYFGKDFETYMRKFGAYGLSEDEIVEKYGFISKPCKAKIVAQESGWKPGFVLRIIEQFIQPQ